MKKRFCLLIALLLSLCLSCAAEPILESTPFLLEAEELLELVDQYQQVPSVALGEEAALNLLKDAELILGAEPTDAQTILDTGAVITLADRAALNVHGALHGWIADIVLGEESEINVFLSDGALMDALLPEELVEPEKLEALKASFTYYGLNISDLDDPDSIYVFDASGNRIHFGNGDKTDSIVYPGEHYTVLVRSGVHTGRQLSFELDPSVPLSLAELLAQNPITAKLSLEATDVAEGADVPFTATLSRAARRKAVVALRVGEADYTIDIPAGASSGSVLVANPNGEDPYLDAGTLTATVTGFTGGDFEKVDYSGATVTANIADTIDTTRVSLSATDGKEGDQYISFTVSLDNAARTAATATVQANGKSHTVTIPAGKSSATLSVPNPNAEDVYLDASTLTATVTGFSGGNFEQVDFSKATATATISDTIDTTRVSLSATDGKEGDQYISFTVSLDNAARTAATATVQANGKSHTVTIPAGKSSATLSVPNPNAEDVYLDASALTASVSAFSGGSFEKVDYSGATATATISDTIDTTRVSLSAADGKEGDSYVTFTVSLSNPAQTAATATVKANGKSHTVTIPAGKSSGTVSVPNPNAEDVYLDASALTATVTAFSGGNFEKVDFSKATATATISDAETVTTVSLAATDGKEGDQYISFTLRLSNPTRTDATFDLTVGDDTITGVTIPAGASTKVIDVPNPNTEDVYLDASTLTATVTGFTGGDFEKVDYSGATVTANIADTIDTTTVSLSAPSVIARYADNVDFTITLSNPAQTSFTANFTVNGETSEIDVPAEKSSFTCSVPNPWKDVPNLDAFPAEISFTSSGNFEKLDFSGARTTVRICDPVVVSLSANDVSEYAPITFNVTLSAPATTAATVTVNVGGTDYTVDTTKVSLSASNYGPTDTHATFTVTLSNPAQTAADVTVNVGGTDYTVYIAASATSGSVSVLINGAPLLTGTVTGLTGANFEAVDYSTATATARTHYTATVSISGHDIGMSDGDIHFTIYLSKAPKTDATATVKVGDANQTVTISAGNTSASLYVRNPHLGELSFVTYTLSAEVTSISGGFTSVDCSGAKTTVSIMPVPGDWH